MLSSIGCHKEAELTILIMKRGGSATSLHHHLLLLEWIIREWVTVNRRKSLVFPVRLIVVITECLWLISIPVIWSTLVIAGVLWVTRVTVVRGIVPLGIIQGHVVEPILWRISISLFSGERGFLVISRIPW